MDIATVETAVINRLKARITGLAVEPFPGDTKSYRLLHPRGAVLAHYAGSIFSRPERRPAEVQLEEMRFELTLVMRNLRTKDAGAYAAIASVKRALLGHRVAGCGRIFLNGISLVDSEDGFWWYVLGISMLSAAVVRNTGDG
jgi:hypothetical protein